MECTMKISSVKEAVAKDEDGAVLPIDGKDGEPYLAHDGSPATMTIVGLESKRMRDITDKQQRRALRRQVAKITPEMLREERIEKAAAAVIAWHGWEGDDGTELACTPENVAALLGAAEHIMEQVEAGVRRHASFFTKPSVT
jgi:hypothetical protein